MSRPAFSRQGLEWMPVVAARNSNERAAVPHASLIHRAPRRAVQASGVRMVPAEIRGGFWAARA
eukprot:4893446-Prymnesium_polylepis.1